MPSVQGQCVFSWNIPGLQGFASARATTAAARSSFFSKVQDLPWPETAFSGSLLALPSPVALQFMAIRFHLTHEIGAADLF